MNKIENKFDVQNAVIETDDWRVQLFFGSALLNMKIADIIPLGIVQSG